MDLFGQLGRDLDVAQSVIGNWVKQARADRSNGKTGLRDAPGLTEEAKLLLKKPWTKVSDPTLLLAKLRRFARYRTIHREQKAAVDEMSRADVDINLGRVRHHLERASSAAGDGPSRKLRTVLAEDITLRPLTFLWRKLIPCNELTILDGDAGVGKSMLICRIIAEIAERGWRTLVINLEDDVATVLGHRLIEADIPDGMCHVFTGVDGEGGSSLRLDLDVTTLESFIVENDIDLVVMDPIFEFMQGIDTNTNGVRDVLTPLRDLAHRARVAFLLTRHVVKAAKKVGLDEHSGMGSASIRGCVRSQLLASRFSDDLVRLEHRKYSSVVKQPDLYYRIEPGDISPFGARAVWETPPMGAGIPDDAPYATKRNTAIGFLLKHGGAQAKLTASLVAEAQGLGIGQTTLKRARAALQEKKR